MFNKKRKEELKRQAEILKIKEVEYVKTLNILEAVKKNIKNRDIYSMVVDRIGYTINSDDYNLNITKNSFIYQRKNSNDEFSLHFYPSEYKPEKIVITEVMWKGRCKTLTEINFIDEHFIGVIEIEYGQIVDGDTEILLSSEVKNIKTIYKDNKVIYKYECEIESNKDCFDNPYTCIEKTTYVNDDRTAVIRSGKGIISEGKIYLNQENTEYLKSRFYNETPYNSCEDNVGLYIWGAGCTTKEEFEFVERRFNEQYGELQHKNNKVFMIKK